MESSGKEFKKSCKTNSYCVNIFTNIYYNNLYNILYIFYLKLY
jgi:hypothetical protein